ncbi:MAG: ATP-binding protein [Propionibacteriaceae bacterium]|nr:ATP-binding protein [Propionibacteriaceae bacterium]
MLIPRPDYIDRIAPFVGQHIIKVLTGLRRCGKSSLLRLVADRLLAEGTPTSHVIYVNFELLESAPLTEATALSQWVTDQMTEPGPYFVFFDEVQEVDHWEKSVNSLFAAFDNIDIYLTGSNSRLLSSELATYIAGRYVTIPVATLSFSEHLAFAQQTGTGAASLADQFDTYRRRGGFPGLYATSYADIQIDQAVADIYNSALIQDTIRRREIRNVDMLRRIANFTLDNIGSPFSARSLSNYFKSQRRPIDPETVLNYLDALCESFILVKVPRYDLQGKKLLTVAEKYYAGDHGLVNALLGHNDRHLPGILENIVGAELRLRGYQTTVGKLGTQEVDFVATKGTERLYVQVTSSLTASDETRQRELAPLLAIRDAYPKIVVSLDAHAAGSYDGIRHIWLPHWLLDR